MKKLLSIFFILILLIYSNVYSEIKKIALVIKPDWYGELEFAQKLVKAGHNLGWQADLLKTNEPIDASYDFAITLVPTRNKTNVPNYLCLFHPKHHYFDTHGFLLPKFKDFTGYLLTYSIKNQKKDFVDPHKYPHMKWYPTSHYNDYVTVNPDKLIYIYSCWGNRINEKKYTNLIRHLDHKPISRIFGSDVYKDLCPKHYQGRIALDGQSVIRTIQDCGIVLILHSEDHLKVKIPSGRIFEAAAASAIIICDENKFVMKHFGDSVLYVDQSASEMKFFKSIDKHIKWIKDNPGLALEKAKRAHEIFVENFLLEDQLLRLEEFHNSLHNK